jgi:hypothetical protein
MYNRIELLHAPGQEQQPAAQRAGVEVLLQPTLPGVYNGGDWLWKLRAPQLSSLEAAAAPLAALHVDRAIYRDGEGGGDWSRRGVYRALLLSLRPGVPQAAVARFERELLAMPRYITSIRGWRLSRVLHSTGARSWSHVWEQRYDALEGLAGTYMLHPYHWAHVDRWFDPESPDWIVDTHLCHSYCRFE